MSGLQANDFGDETRSGIGGPSVPCLDRIGEPSRCCVNMSVSIESRSTSFT